MIGMLVKRRRRRKKGRFLLELVADSSSGATAVVGMKSQVFRKGVHCSGTKVSIH